MSSLVTTVTAAAQPERRTRRTYSNEQKAEYVARFAASGMTLPAFCREAGVSVSTLASWLPRQRRQPCDAVASFAQVHVRPEPVPASVTLSLHWPTGLKLEIVSADAAMWHGLGLLLKTLQA